MKKLFVILLLILSEFSCVAQSDSIVEYDWLELNSVNPDTIYAISFEKMKLAELPKDLSNFHNLRQLNLSKNKLVELPDFIGDFLFLEKLDISKNELQNFPVEICKLNNLKVLIANRNFFDKIPECIGYCTNLEVIDLWDTPIASFPKSFSNLKKLQTLDLQGIKYGPTFQKEFQQSLSWVVIKFDPPCNCMESSGD
jgi:Leucine-rich repeat (LRR) protein